MKIIAKRFNYRHVICILIGLLLALLFYYLSPSSLWRLCRALYDFAISIAYFFCVLFGIPSGIVPTINEIPPEVSSDINLLPADWDLFTVKLSMWGKSLLNGDTYGAYFSGFGGFLNFLLLFVLIAVPVFILVRVAFKRYCKQSNHDINKESKPLRCYKLIALKCFLPARRWVRNMYRFIRVHKIYWIIYLVLFLVYSNAISIAISGIAYYLYFVVSFDFLHLYRQIYKLFCDLSVIFKLPLWLWIVVLLWLFNRFRKRIGLDSLQHMELKNKGFINSLPVVSMLCGTMGSRKTTILTDMALSQEAIFRNKAFEKLLEQDLMFPNFSWQKFEHYLKNLMRSHVIYNLASCRKAIRARQQYFNSRLWFHSSNRVCRAVLWGYDFNRYGLTYNDNLSVRSLFDVLETYAQLYFIYVITSSLLIANYSIRSDMLLNDLGNFPLWNGDFFARDSRLIDSYSRHAHILNFDTLRLGKQVIEDSKNNSFEFGVVVITEGGKERGNQVTNKGKNNEIDSPLANRNNDLFNLWLKMVRHSATVDNFPFVKVLIDEQRPESMGADVRELCDIIHIAGGSDRRLTLPFYWIEDLFYSLLLPEFQRFYYDFRFHRADNTLLLYLYKKFVSWVCRRYNRTYNMYGYFEMTVETEAGTMDGAKDVHDYYLMTKKIFSRRFSTDCFSDYFAVKALTSPIGVEDVPEYATERADFEELLAQRSYFISDLTRVKWFEDKEQKHS